MPKIRLFVYGTLKEPDALTRLLGGAQRWRALGPGRVQGALYDLGDYPGLVGPAAADEFVRGLVVELTDPDVGLARLDSYEGVHDGLYVRQEMPVALDSGRRVKAWSYVYNRSVAGRPRIDEWPPRP